MLVTHTYSGVCANKLDFGCDIRLIGGEGKGSDVHSHRAFMNDVLEDVQSYSLGVL